VGGGGRKSRIGLREIVDSSRRRIYMRSPVARDCPDTRDIPQVARKLLTLVSASRTRWGSNGNRRNLRRRRFGSLDPATLRRAYFCCRSIPGAFSSTVAGSSADARRTYVKFYGNRGKPRYLPSERCSEGTLPKEREREREREREGEREG